MDLTNIKWMYDKSEEPSREKQSVRPTPKRSFDVPGTSRNIRSVSPPSDRRSIGRSTDTLMSLYKSHESVMDSVDPLPPVRKKTSRKPLRALEQAGEEPDKLDVATLPRLHRPKQSWTDGDLETPYVYGSRQTQPNGLLEDRKRNNGKVTYKRQESSEDLESQHSKRYRKRKKNYLLSTIEKEQQTRSKTPEVDEEQPSTEHNEPHDLQGKPSEKSSKRRLSLGSNKVSPECALPSDDQKLESLEPRVSFQANRSSVREAPEGLSDPEPHAHKDGTVITHAASTAKSRKRKKKFKLRTNLSERELPPLRQERDVKEVEKTVESQIDRPPVSSRSILRQPSVPKLFGGEFVNDEENVETYRASSRKKSVMFPTEVERRETERSKRSETQRSARLNSARPSMTESAITGITYNDEFIEDKRAERKKFAERHQTPNKFCKLVAEKPELCFAITLLLQTLMIGMNGILYAAGYNIMQINFESVPVNLFDENAFRTAEAWNQRDVHPNIYQRIMVDIPFPMWVRGRPGQMTEVTYEKKDSNVLTADTFRIIQQYEDSLFAEPALQQICMVTKQQTCVKPKSLIRFFDGTYSQFGSLFTDMQFTHICETLTLAQRIKETRKELQYHLSKDAFITNTSCKATITRSFFFSGHDVRKEENEDAFVNKLIDKFRDGKKRYKDQLDIYYINSYLFFHETRIQALLDLCLAIGSFTFIFIILMVQTRSVWISCWAIYSIFADFFSTNLIYRIIFGYKYIGFLHILSVFIILGIGADDIFVFYDHWRLSQFYKYESLSQRLSHVYRRAAASMFFTSLTTMIAFLVSASSPLLAIRTFGLFSGICVFINYLSVITFIPCVVIFHHKHFSGMCRRCCMKNCGSLKCCQPNQDTDEPSTAPVTPRLRTASTFGNERSDKLTERDEIRSVMKNSSHRGNKLVQFLRGPYYRFVTHYIMKWVILIFGIGLLAVFAIYSSKIEPDDKQIQIYKRNTNYGNVLYHRLYSFRPNELDEYVRMYVIFGLKSQDFNGCDFKNIEDHENCRGSIQYDTSFNMNSNEAQQSLLDFCSRLVNMSRPESDQLRININDKGEIDADCFMLPMDRHLRNLTTGFYETAFRNLKYYVTFNKELGLPISTNDTLDFMKTLYYMYGNIPADFDRFFEIWVTLWLNNNYSYKVTEDWLRYFRLVAEVTHEDTSYMFNYTFAPYNTKLLYAAIRVNLTMSTSIMNYREDLPIMEKWEQYLSAEKAKFPEPLQSAILATPSGINTWHWMKVQKTLIDTAFMGLGVGISLALPVLIIATLNWIVGLLATLCIAAGTVSVIGMVPMAGWKVDAMVSINLCLVVGMSVDYSVHIAQAYCKSQYKSRRGRIKDMLEEVGVSVLWGGVTTMGAAAFMLFAQIRFYLQFGAFILTTIGFSLIYSLLFLPAVLAICGPENERGSLKPLIRWFERKCRCCRKEEDETDGVADTPRSDALSIEASTPRPAQDTTRSQDVRNDEEQTNGRTKLQTQFIEFD